MLVELAVRDLGVIARASLSLGPGMTALTGETGAGKTLLVEALELLVGGRPDSVLVRPGATQALVEGRFEDGDEETILARSLPAAGRSKAWVNSRMAPVSALAEAGLALVELHGQHAHQSLLGPLAQRAALDAFAGVDSSAREGARAALQQVAGALAATGGEARARSRQIDLLAYQIDELARAGLTDPAEDDTAAIEEDRLARATAHREAAQASLAALVGHGVGDGAGGGAGDGAADPNEGASGALRRAISALAGHPPLSGSAGRLLGLQAELEDTARELRRLGESLEDDPGRLNQVRARRQLLRELQRKYGPSLADVVAYATAAREELAGLESHEHRVAELESQRAGLLDELEAAESVIGQARRAGAPLFAAEVELHLRALAMPRARFEVQVGAGAGDEVTYLLGANPGEPALPLSKVASGGELARAMLAVRLVLGGWAGSEAPDRPAGTASPDGARGRPTLVFDEVDAGVGGQAALAVGRALARLARTHQVVVVTHLPQVAAFADHQVAIEKVERDGRTVAELSVLDEAGRVVEISRMLSGQPASATARDHATELLELAAAERRG